MESTDNPPVREVVPVTLDLQSGVTKGGGLFISTTRDYKSDMTRKSGSKTKKSASRSRFSPPNRCPFRRLC